MSASESPRSQVSVRPALRSRLITIASGSVAVAYALFVFVPAQQSIAGMQRKLRDEQSQVSKSLTLVQPIRELEDKLVSTEHFIKAWRGKAPVRQHVASVFADVITLARENGAEVTSLSPQAEQALETISLNPVSLQVEGSYRSLHGMLARLEAMQGLIWIDEVHLQPQEKGTGSITCTLKLVIFANRTEISG